MVKDGLKTVELIVDTTSGTNASFTNVSGTETIVNSELATSACSGTKVSLEFPVLYTGSPVRGNNAVQYGVATSTSNSGLSVAFGKAFALAPNVFLTPASGVQPYTNGVSAGSFILIVPAGSNTIVGYLAIGSGRI